MPRIAYGRAHGYMVIYQNRGVYTAAAGSVEKRKQQQSQLLRSQVVVFDACDAELLPLYLF